MRKGLGTVDQGYIFFMGAMKRLPWEMPVGHRTSDSFSHHQARMPMRENGPGTWVS